MLPLEELRLKYLPVEVFPEKYNVSVPTIMRLIKSNKIRKAELKAEGCIRRTLHVNYEEVLRALGREDEIGG